MILRFNADIRDKGIDVHSAAYLFNLERRRPEPLEDPRLQNEDFQVIRHAIAGVATAAKRQVFIVHGGPGTGKSVIAVRLLAEVLASKRLGFFIAPNKAFRDTLVEQLARGSRDYREDDQALFQSSWSFHAADFMEDRLHEVLVVDEAHRLKDEAYQYRGSSMVEDMVRATRISVFFLDETQRVPWNDSGTVARSKARKPMRTKTQPGRMPRSNSCR